MLKRDVWFGVIIGYDSGITAKGVMRVINTDDPYWTLERMDGRIFILNIDNVSVIMADPLTNVSDTDTEEELMKLSEVRDWLTDNVRKREEGRNGSF